MWYCVDVKHWLSPWLFHCVCGGEGVCVGVCGVCVWVCGGVACVSVFMCTPCRMYMFEPDGQILEFFGEFRDHKGDEVRCPIAVPWFTLNGLLCA